MFISKDLLKECASEFDVILSDETVDKFDRYAYELVKYNEKL